MGSKILVGAKKAADAAMAEAYLFPAIMAELQVTFALRKLG